MEGVDEEECPHRGFDRQVQEVLVALIIHVHVGEPVGLPGDSDGRKDNLDAVAQTLEGFRSCHFPHEYLVDEVGYGWFEGRPGGSELVRVTCQDPDPMASFLELPGDEPAQISGRPGNENPGHDALNLHLRGARSMGQDRKIHWRLSPCQKAAGPIGSKVTAPRRDDQTDHVGIPVSSTKKDLWVASNVPVGGPKCPGSPQTSQSHQFLVVGLPSGPGQIRRAKRD